MGLILKAGSFALAEEITVKAVNTYNQDAFTYTRTLKQTTPRYSCYSITFPTALLSDFKINNTVYGELFLPQKAAAGDSLPAAICFHILHDDFDRERFMCSQLAENGVASFFFKQPYYAERGGKVGRKQLYSHNTAVFVKGFQQGFDDARRAIDFMQALPEVDPFKVGVIGTSMGAMQAAALCGMDERVTRAYLLLVGANMWKIIEQARETRHIYAFIQNQSEADQMLIRKVIDRSEPLRAAPALKKLAEKNTLRIICAEKDQVVPLEASKELAEAIGMEEKIVWLKGLNHYTAIADLPWITKDLVAFFVSDRPDAWQPAKADTEAGLNEMELLRKFLSELSDLLSSELHEESAHIIGLSGRIKVGRNNIKPKLNLFRGSAGRYLIQGDLPYVGEVNWGQGLFPWMGGGEKVFCGTKTVPDDPPSLENLITPARLLNYRLAIGVLGMIALAPELFVQYFTVKSSFSDTGERVLDIKIAHKRHNAQLKLLFSADGRTPLELHFEVVDLSGVVFFDRWSIKGAGAADLFEPSAGLSRQEVPRKEVLLLQAAVFEYFLEALE